MALRLRGALSNMRVHVAHRDYVHCRRRCEGCRSRGNLQRRSRINGATTACHPQVDPIGSCGCGECAVVAHLTSSPVPSCRNVRDAACAPAHVSATLRGSFLNACLDLVAVAALLSPCCRQAAPSVGLVGKGIVYDTGGLNLKSTGGRGMKGDRQSKTECICVPGQSHAINWSVCLSAGDMAGSAATLGAFAFWAKFSAAHPEAGFPGENSLQQKVSHRLDFCVSISVATLIAVWTCPCPRTTKLAQHHSSGRFASQRIASDLLPTDRTISSPCTLVRRVCQALRETLSITLALSDCPQHNTVALTSAVPRRGCKLRTAAGCFDQALHAKFTTRTQRAVSSLATDARTWRANWA